MTAATVSPRGFDLRSLGEALAPGRVRFDPLGLVSGYKAYRIYSGLAARSDAELAHMGLSRGDLPGAAMQAVENLRRR